MNDWLSTALNLIEDNQAAVLVTVIGTRGSAPRDAGTRMIVSADHCHGTIGGGHLEYKAIALAREQLSQMRTAACPTAAATDCAGLSAVTTAKATPSLHRFPLGASLGQCCGGLVHLLLEPLDDTAVPWLRYLQSHLDAGQAVIMMTQAVPGTEEQEAALRIGKLLVSERDHHGELSGVQGSALHQARQQLVCRNTPPVSMDPSLWIEKLLPDDFRILIFGAGHVGKALVNVLATLPCSIRWIDSRAAEFPATMPSNVERVVSTDPELELAAAPDGSYVVIMTHNHALDETLCSQALQIDSLAWCGLIGSASKQRRFVQRFRNRGMSDAAIARLTCPIGLPELDGKHPGEIAVSVAAQILWRRQQQLASRDDAGATVSQHAFA